ncbi:MAG: hypothetical protein Q8O90_04360 [Elusimicrobiota bacterium]|nr:hypothetical protein [Elusimicrobiota bacterium]
MDDLEKDKEALSWLTRAWDDYTGNFPLLLPVLLTQAALSAGSFYIIGRYHSLPAALPYMFFVLTPIATGLNLVYIKIARGGGARYLDLFSAFPIYHRALAVSLGLGFMTMGGALLLIVPGLIIYLTFCFSEYAVVDRRTGIKESFELSAKLTEGWKSRLFIILTLILLVNVLVPDIYVVTGGLKNPSASLDLKPWTVAAAALKTLVFLPWLGLALARAYNFLLLPPVIEPAQDETPVD